MTSVSSVGSGLSPSHLQLLQDDSLKDGKSRTLAAARQGDRASAAGDSPATASSDKSNDAQSDQPVSQDDLLTKINALITNELSSGKLSSDRAAVLRDVFSNAFAGSADGTSAAANSASEAPDEASGANATASTPPQDASSAIQTPSASAAAASSASPDVGSVLNDFLKLLQDAKSTASTYGASGSSTAEASSSGARLINYRA